MRSQRWSRLFSGMVLLLSGCATQVPAPIATAPVHNPQLEQVRAHPGNYQGVTVRWGGTIAEVENQEHDTVLVIVDRPLESDGQPQVNDMSQGRFLAQAKGFLDPVVYAPGRLLTVVGTVAGARTRKIGSYSYQYPVVAVESYYLWPRAQQTVRYYPCYDRFWYSSPLYPWYQVPYSWPYSCP